MPWPGMGNPWPAWPARALTGKPETPSNALHDSVRARIALLAREPVKRPLPPRKRPQD